MADHQLEMVESSIVKASSCLPNPLLNDMVPLTIFHLATFNIHVPMIYIFEAGGPSSEAMKQALVRTLAHFPHLAGRMALDKQGRPCTHLNNAGICYTETRIGTTLAETLLLNPSSPGLKKLLPPVEGSDELMRIQINRFTCGGLVMGGSNHHRVTDTQGMGNFCTFFAKVLRGLELDSRPPYHDRAAISDPRNPPLCEFNHRAIEFSDGTAAIPFSPSSIASFSFHYSPEFMRKLRAHVRSLDPGRRYTTFECLLTHLWKKVTVARGLHTDEFTHVRVSVNGREKMKPRVPMGYFGNLVLWAFPTLKVKDLVDESYVFVTETIRDAVAKVDSAYFQSLIDFGETLKMEERRALVATAPVGTLQCPNIVVDSWLKFSLQEIDFGYGPPSSFIYPQLLAEGWLVFTPSTKEEGGVEVFMSLQHQHVDHFKQISHLLPGEPEQSKRSFL